MHNRLADETSPYLRQHADNPVHWQPWDDQALALARTLDRPILLSIGYSACHWCHVMAHESFADPQIATLMNAHFVNVKVDREERPDLDRVYQLAHQILTQQNGGWPLTMFLDPQTLIPFFGGTYFPRSPRHGLPGYSDLLLRIAEVWDGNRDALSAQCAKIADVLKELNPRAPGERHLEDHALLQAARAQLGQQYDSAEGGFGQAPKFPMPTAIERLLLDWAFGRHRRAQDREVLDMVMTTLTKMARGGIFDHVGGGFCRYSTDRKWLVPHFEKMLCDNGQLLSIYTDAFAVSGDDLFGETMAGIAGWMLREMRHPDGGFYASLDADSEGQEGRFYLWRRDEARRLLTADEYLVVETLYGLDKPANFEGRWILHRRDAWRSVVERLMLDRGEADALLASARAKLLEARDGRPRPNADHKLLASWNGLAIKGLAGAAHRLERPEWLLAAQQSADFLYANMWRDGVLYASWAAGSARYPGYLDDYTNLLDGLLALLRTAWREQDARFAIALADALVRDFEDTEHGGFFFTRHDHEALIHRPKPTLDEAVPAGNGVAARVLMDLGHLFGRNDYLESARRSIVWSRGLMEHYPAGHCSLLAALELDLAEPEQIIIRGPTASLAPWLEAATAGYHPWRRAYAIPYGRFPTLPSYLPKLVSADLQQKTQVYRCRGFTCDLPISSLEDFRAQLAGTA